MRLLPGLFLWGTAAAQSVELHSEFQRIDPFGRVVTADRSEYPREILSPELPRNAHTIFHVSVSVPENTSYFLYVGSNPPNLVETRLFKEDFTRAGDQWIPDQLSLVRTPAFGTLPDFAANIPGQTTRCYLLDIWVPPQADVRRARVEVLLKVGIWYVAPMEIRIVEARVPQHTTAPRIFGDRHLPRIDDPADAAAMECLSDYLDGRPQTWMGGDLNVRDAIRRSAEQDMAIARLHGPIPQELRLLAANGFVERWLSTPGFNWSGAEWYLRVRDWIYRNVK